MQISSNDWDNYTRTQEAIRKKAASLMQRWIDKYGIEDKNHMIRFAKALTDKYGEAAASEACQMFEEIAAASKIVTSAVPADVATYGKVASSIYNSLDKSKSGKKIPGVIEQLTKQAAEDTMLQNAQRNGAEWAWVPDGGACIFCRTLAANGWQHLSKSTKENHAKHIHANCNCEFVVRFNKKDSIQGHDFEKYKREYEEHKGDLKAWRRELEAISREMQEESRAMVIYDNAIRVEPKITEDVIGIANETGTELFGLENRIKSKERFLQKVKKNNPDYTVKDIIRYTFGVDNPDNYTEKTLQVIESLKARGYNLVEIKNYWNMEVPYKGINTTVVEKDGQLFEVQFHTKESFIAKENMHELYEAQSKIADEFSEEYIKLDSEMNELSKNVITPKGAEGLK